MHTSLKTVKLQYGVTNSRLESLEQNSKYRFDNFMLRKKRYFTKEYKLNAGIATFAER